MKLNRLLCGCMLLLPFCIQAQDVGYVPPPSSETEEPGMPLRSALNKLGKLHKISFAYSSKLIDSKKVPAVSSTKKPLPEVLDDMLTPLQLQYKKIDEGLYVIQPALISEQNIAVPIKGTVKDKDGQPIPGVTIQVKGTSVGTVSTPEGTFTLNAPDANVTLLFSYIGYDPQEIALEGRTELNVVMATSSSQLEQVVVVGYGTRRKRDLTGAIGSVQGEELTKQPVNTATQGVQGKLAGVQIISSGAPGSQPLVRVRGTGSMLAGAEPLYVVDGVLTNDIRNINTADIVSMDILKDASSAAIYGVRAANGVVIITTKRGKIGKMEVSYNMNAGFREVAHLVKMANSTQYTDYLKDAAPNVTLPGYNVSTNWYDAILRKGFQQVHNISLSGGSEKFLYYFNAGYLTDEGIVNVNKYDRLTIRSNNEYNISDKLKFVAQFSYMRSNTRYVDLQGIYTNTYRASPLIPVMQHGKYGNTAAFGNVGNPVLTIDKNNDKLQEGRVQGTTYLEYSPWKFLKLRSSMSVNQSNFNRKKYNYKFLNDETTFLIAGGNQQRPESQLTMVKEQNQEWLWDNTATFQQRFGDHDLTVLAGYTAQKYQGEYIEGSRRNVPISTDLWYLIAGDPNTSTVTADGDKYARTSILGRVNYSYKDKYLATISFRNDASSRFPSENRNGYFPAVGLGWVLSQESFLKDQQIFDFLKLRGSWGRIGNDNIESNLYILTGSTGQQYFFDGKATLGTSLADIKNRNLKWETTEEYDFGLEFTTLKQRLTGEINYYNKKTIDALVGVKIPGLLGDPDNEYITNAGSFVNKGWEFTLQWKDKINEDFDYTFGGNLTLNDNEVTGLNQGQPLLKGGVGGQGPVTKTDNGHPIGSFFVYDALGVFVDQAAVDAYLNKDGQKIQPDAKPGDLRYRDANNDGRITVDDKIYAGSYQPKLYYGLNAGVNYKGIDLSMDFYGNAGNKIYNGKKAFRYEITDNVESDYADKRWTATRPSATDPRVLSNSMPASTYFIESGNFFRLNNVTLGYTLPKQLLERMKMNRLRICLTSQNLFTVKRFSGFSPEMISTNPKADGFISAQNNSSPLESGIELMPYPTTRTFAAGLNVTF
ncbi:SusC/RagA family TonB-linked outer membrane protein [Chitinophaga niabensis]|uniref:TonB-linked outer membrane protein, SusC/RagA family n=1 Tax=Chitinophaga niabensis TaxID=536979 RepID=A0A1N6K8I1_9BACT|nr:SusC/RagA family TonB-linked outer membrane protein [Chitinophaga niabensis]SIO52616.1 TonB-linked outer membrane protein, SusC/RagA family [Chitinophaga niabensis]